MRALPEFSRPGTSRPLVFAHRGGAALRPENTIAAFDHAELSLADPENRSTGEQLFRRPEESFTLALQRRFERFDLGINLLAAGERTDVGFPDSVTLDSYVLVDLTAGWSITDRLSLRARVENLLDEDYELADGFNTPERGVYVALRYGQSR